MPKRRTLPDRRLLTNFSIEWEGQEFNISVGFYDFNCLEVGEVFADCGKSPQAVQQLVADACIIISVALQYGVPPEALGKSLSRFETGVPYTIIGLVCDAIVRKGWKRNDENNPH